MFKVINKIIVNEASINVKLFFFYNEFFLIYFLNKTQFSYN
jgi:hypothetical protein